MNYHNHHNHHQHQNHILQKIIGQSISLFEGKKDQNAHHHFPGHRPSTITVLKDKSCKGLGYLLAMIENRIMFEGFLNQVNAFDQPGVELGKEITKEQTKSNSLGNQIIKELIN